jgi:predicted Zn-ribbon and HTH transcriptional regulator
MKSQREYIGTSSRCPCCDSSDVEGRFVEIDSGGAFQPVDCSACGFSWTDNYKLIGYYFDSEETPPPLAEQLSRHLSAEEKTARAVADAEGPPARYGE